MKLAFIGPIQSLEKCVIRSEGVHMALTPQVLRSKEYALFYLQQHLLGSTIILDNGTFEEGKPRPISELKEAADMVSADIVVAPDYPGEEWEKTYSALGNFALKVSRDILGVPQSLPGDIDGFLKCFEQMDNLKYVTRLGVSILNCPIAFGKWTNAPKDIELNRFAATAFIREHVKPKTKLHYLGLGSRIDFIQYYTEAESLDTSSPIWNPWNGHNYRGGSVIGGKVVDPVDFNAQLPRNAIQWENMHSCINVLKRYARRAEGRIQ